MMAAERTAGPDGISLVAFHNSMNVRVTFEFRYIESSNGSIVVVELGHAVDVGADYSFPAWRDIDTVHHTLANKMGGEILNWKMEDMVDVKCLKGYLPEDRASELYR